MRLHAIALARTSKGEAQCVGRVFYQKKRAGQKPGASGVMMEHP
jgi:hypothetical protein